MNERMVPLSKVLELLELEAKGRERFEQARTAGYPNAVPLDDLIARVDAIGREKFPDRWPGA